ncbi:MAG: peptidoglycan DD-metalloendopeptidase family protein [Pseudomonadota bacterium]
MALTLALAFAGGAAAQADKRDAERRLQEVRKELQRVASERRKLEGQRGAVTRELRQADEQVGGVQRALRGTETTLQRDSATLARLQDERAQSAAGLAAKREELAGLLRASQLAGGDAPLKAMLAQDRLAEAERVLTYQGYLQRGRVQRIREITAELARIDLVEREITERRAALASDQKKQREQLQALETARKQRAGMLAGIDKQYQDRAGREKALGRDARALQNLLAQLRSAAAKAARDAARAKAETARRTVAPRSKAPAARRTQVASTPTLRVGGLAWPVSGSLLASYGGRMPDGRRSDGVLIGASAGTPVKAVADGTVVFADWMTGYGMILIIDHGNGYMSLYAHNDGLLRDAGDAVKRGDPVASVGSSGGQDRAGLYFELRRNGQPVDPGSWLSRQ